MAYHLKLRKIEMLIIKQLAHPIYTYIKDIYKDSFSYY